MAPAAARAANDAKRKQKEDLNEAVGLGSFGKNIINIFITIITLVVVIICLNFTIFNICGTSTTLCEFLREHRSTHNPVSSGHSNRPVVDLSPTYNFRECAYVCARPRVHQGLKGGFNVHIIRQKKGGSGKRPKWIGEPWLKVLFSRLKMISPRNSPDGRALFGLVRST